VKQVLEAREPLSREEAAALMHGILAGDVPELQLAALLGALNARTESAQELAGFVDALREVAIDIPLSAAERALLVDTCGTGADSSGTFNISTAAALVAAAAGATVAKHGNRAVTSSCGSADVLEALGVPVALSPDAAADALRRSRFAFLFAPALHPALKAVLPVRRALGVRTVFNVLGPLLNPARAQAQVMGVHSAHLVPVVAEAMQLLNVRHAFVVHGTYQQDGHRRSLDELSISGPSTFAEVCEGTVTLGSVWPEELGLTPAPIEALRTRTAEENAATLREIFAGARGPRREIVLLNAAAVLAAADLACGLGDGLVLAAAAIDSGAATSLLAQLARA
jgi:anthranilate phosphoribosyltransferase